MTIKVTKVDEAPTIAAVKLGLDTDITATTDPFNVKTEEEIQLDPSGIGSGANIQDTLPIFEATDPEGMLTGSEAKDTRIKWSVSGPDAKRFEVIRSPGHPQQSRRPMRHTNDHYR